MTPHSADSNRSRSMATSVRPVVNLVAAGACPARAVAGTGSCAGEGDAGKALDELDHFEMTETDTRESQEHFPWMSGSS